MNDFVSMEIHALAENQGMVYSFLFHAVSIASPQNGQY